MQPRPAGLAFSGTTDQPIGGVCLHADVTRPIADNATNEGWQINRRTDIVLVGSLIKNVGGAGSLSAPWWPLPK